MEQSTDAEVAETGTGKKLSGKEYLKELRKLQTELCHLQEWVKETRQRIIIVFEGRDAAGKGGLIRAITERVSPRIFQVVALPAPSGSREEPALHPTLSEPVSCSRRSDHLRSELVQSRRHRVRHGLLRQEDQLKKFLAAGAGRSRTVLIKERNYPPQVLAGSQQRGAKAAFRGSHQRSNAAMEAFAHGPAIARTVV